MYEEERIFGPFTIRQFLYILPGVGIAYAIYSTSPTKISIVLIVPVLIATFVLTKRNAPKKIDIKNIESYFAEKKAMSAPDEYKQWLKKKTAELASQAAMRRERGVSENKELNDVLNKFESELATYTN